LGRRILFLFAVVVPAVAGLVPVGGRVPVADALGGAVCTIGGLMTFSPPGAGGSPADAGVWRIGPGQIECDGALNGYRIFGTGPFEGSGTYTAVPAAGGPCLHHVGTGTVDYYIRSGAMIFHRHETHQFVLLGAGEFRTPTLRGTVQLVPPYDGNCLTKPVTRASFVAQAAMPSTAPFFFDEGAGSSDGRS
jgi:hypothetical protein